MGRLLDEGDVIDAIYKALRTPLPDYRKDPFHDSMGVAIAMANEIPPAQPEPSEEWRKKHYEQAYNQGFVDACKMFERSKDIPLDTDDIFDAELAKRILNNK